MLPAFVSLEDARARKGGAFPSPCVNVCRMSAVSGLCEGCWRTLDEIRLWSGLDDAGRQACWARVEARQRAAGLRGYCSGPKKSQPAAYLTRGS
nr:DUF1289 domain-containing protein [Tepidicella baoligensis]